MQAAALLVSALLGCISMTRAIDGRVPVPYKPGVDVKGQCPKLRIAVVNGVNFHFEVLSGIMHLLQPYEKQVEIFLSPYARTANFDGAWEIVRWSKSTFKRTDAKPSSLSAPYDLVILVSPDYELQANEALIKLMQPRMTLCLVHNANYEHMDKLLAISPRMELLTLSPHVAAALARTTGRKTDWMLAVYPVPLEDHCKNVPRDKMLGMCIRGFAMQGKFSNLRRNYTNMWRQISSKLEEIKDPQVGRVFHMNVLGKGPDRLALPPELNSYVTVHRRLAYRAFYEVIGRNAALVPSLATARYYTEKFSSTIMTSLQTGTPIIATQQLLKAYAFIPREAVFEQKDGEEEMDVMMRVVKADPEAVLKTRDILAALRDKLNERAYNMLEGFIREACTASPKEVGGGGGARHRTARRALAAAGAGLEACDGGRCGGVGDRSDVQQGVHGWWWRRQETVWGAGRQGVRGERGSSRQQAHPG